MAGAVKQSIQADTASRCGLTQALAVTGEFMEKIDLKAELKELYRPSAKVVSEVDVPQFNFLMIDGEGDPNTSELYKEAVQALFSVSYAAKFSLKRSKGIDYVVMPLEGLWWADDMASFLTAEKAKWKWTLMIMQPPCVTRDHVDSALRGVKAKKGFPRLEELRFAKFSEGRCAQMLHIGPFSEEGPTIQRIHEYIEESSALSGKHHEIYLSDIRRASPDRWKTIIRQPME